MALMLLGDWNVESVWLNVRNNRELLRNAVVFSVKRFDQIQSGFQALIPSVSVKNNVENVRLIPFYVYA